MNVTSAALPLVFVDIETTGGSPQTSRVLELAAIRVEGGKITASMDALLDPGEDVPWFITQLTGIRSEDTWGAPTFSSVVRDFDALLEGALFIAHNAQFDYAFLAAEYQYLGRRLKHRKACTVQLSRHFYPDERNHRLDAVIDRHNLQVANRHRAYGDAKALVDFYAILCEEFGEATVLDALLKQLHESAASKRPLRTKAVD